MPALPVFNAGFADATNAPAATGSGAAETLNSDIGLITTEALTTAAGASSVRTLTNSKAKKGMAVSAHVVGGTNTKPHISISAHIAADGAVGVALQNRNSAALDGTVIYAFQLLG